MNSRYTILLSLIILTLVNCTKPYTPKAITGVNNYLVVEGTINVGAGDSTVIKLSRTVNLAAGVSSLPELNATISIQDNQNQAYSLKDLGNGAYVSAALNLDNTRQYRLNITTSDGKNYISDYVTTVKTPPIDSIGFTIKNNGDNDGMQVYVNTHDPNNNTHYYRWDYTETWTFHAKYYSYYITNGDTMLPRKQSQLIYQCWTNDLSTGILLGSSAKLTQDVIYQSPITFVPSTSEKIEREYSILLKQYGLTVDAYNYFDQLKKNTEELGSIFDAQPTQLTGNVHCTSDPSVIAIGYVTAGTVQQKRVFIDNDLLPNTWVPTYPYNCEQDTALYYNPKTMQNDVDRLLVPLGSDNIATLPIYQLMSIIGYMYTDPDCADCSIRGTTTPPSFWK